MDLFVYFIFAAFFFFVGISYYFFSRVVIVRLLQQASYPLITCICSLFFTLIFMVMQYWYMQFDGYFTIEPLWQGKLIFFFLCIFSLFFIIRFILPLVPEAIPTVHFQEILFLPVTTDEAFQKCIEGIQKEQGDILLKTSESCFLIAQIASKGIENEQAYVIEIKISSRVWSCSQVHFLCYPASRGGFIEKKDFQRVINSISQSLISSIK